MSFFMAFKMSWESIKGNKMRSFLTMLGIIIGVASVIILVSLMQGATRTVSDTIESFGTNTITVNIMRRGSNRMVTTDDLDKLVGDNEEAIDSYVPSFSQNATFKVGSENLVSTVEGTFPAYTQINNVDVSVGRFFNDLDVSDYKRVIVIGEYNANELFGSKEAAIDQRIKINGEMFTVIGVLENKAGGTEHSSDDKGVIPYTTASRVFKDKNLTAFTFQAKSADTVDAAMDAIESFLLDKFGTEDAYYIMNMKEMLDEFNSVMGLMQNLIAGIAGISLLVAGIGIMNIMLVSVTERTREIGIRKAIGAKRKSILVQFMIEAIVVSLMGGSIGIVLGYIGTAILGNLMGYDFTPSVGVVSGCLTYSLAVGLFFGLHPANKASKLNPIEALRFE